MRIFRKHRLTPSELLLLAVVGVSIIVLSGQSQQVTKVPSFDLRVEAARKTLRAFAVLKEERLRRGIPIDDFSDPAQSGLIGAHMSPITTVPGDYTAKLTTINPNWAAFFVEMFEEAGLNPGDTVWFSVTGSFPALNVAALVTAETYGLVPVWVASLGASSYGANHPDWTWADMEHTLVQEGLLSRRALFLSLGGNNNVAAELDSLGRALLAEAALRNGYDLLVLLPLQRAVDTAWARLYRTTGGLPRLFVNIGGGVLALGTSEAADRLDAGLNTPRVLGELEDIPVEGLAMRALRHGVPVLHVERVVTLARRWGLPVAPGALASPGEGPLYARARYPLALHAGMLAAYALLIFLTMNGILSRWLPNPRHEENTEEEGL